MSLIAKADLVASSLVNFPDSIAERKITPHIEAAETYELEPKIGENLLGALKTVNEAEDPEAVKELKALKSDFVDPYLILASYVRFLEFHGRNITPAGMTKPKDPKGSFESLGGDERRVMIRRIESDLNVRETRLKKALSNANWKFDGVSYQEREIKPKSGRKFKISAI